MNRANLYDPLPLESEPVRKADAPGADQPTEKNAADPLPLGPFTKARKLWRVGDQFKSEDGKNATVTAVEKSGRVFYECAGGSGFFLNG